jgi:hypothetical protein
MICAGDGDSAESVACQGNLQPERAGDALWPFEITRVLRETWDC